MKPTFDNIIASSEKMYGVLRQVTQIAPTDSTVLITGESGTGKELIANALHHNSPRKQGPFIKVNCAAMTRELVESELFGHEKGAFTGALALRAGKFEAADGGTLFLDEIGDMSVETQAKVLRVLQERELERVGGNQTLKVDVRVLAATNRNLHQMVQEGKFREDLYYRVHVIPVSLPPLRERPEDIPLLASFFLKRFSHAMGKAVLELSPEALRHLMLYDWPGNVRELANVMERAVVLSTTPQVSSDLLLLRRRPATHAAESHCPLEPMREARDKFERAYLVQVLSAARGNVSRASALAKKDRAEFYRLLHKYALDPLVFKNA